MKKIFTILAFLPFACLSAMAQDNGTTPNGIVWDLDEEGVLTISGNDSIADIAVTDVYSENEDDEDEGFTDEEKAEILSGNAPWQVYAKEIKKIVIGKDVTYIGAYSFANCSETELVIKGRNVKVADNAFLADEDLTTITSEGSILSIGEKAFGFIDAINDIYLSQTTAPEITTNTFDFTDLEDASIYIPCNATETYENADVWAGYVDSTYYKLLGTIGFEFDDPSELIFDVTFNFVERNPYTLTIDEVDGATVTKTETTECGTYELAATVDSGYTFVSWTDGVTDQKRTITLSCDTTIGVTIETVSDADTTTTEPIVKDSVTFKASAVDGRIGSVDITYGRYAVGDTVTVTAIPAEGYIFNSWWDNTYDRVYTLVLTQDTVLTATFRRCNLSEDSVNISANITSAYAMNGTITGAGNYAIGDTVTIIVTPKEGYALSHWNTGATSDTLKFVAKDHMTLIAYLEEANAIETIAAEEDFVNVYNVSGIMLKRNVKRSEALNELSKGIYIVGGKKVAKVEE